MQVKKAKLQGSDSHWFLFLILPFFGAITAIRNYRSPWAKNVLWAFVVYYGFTFAIAKENNEVDIVRYIDDLKELHGQSLTFLNIIDIFKDRGDADVLKTIVDIIVSRFTDNTQVLIAAYGFIFGFFYSRCIWYLFKRLQGKLKWGTVLMIVVFSLINPFWNLNGFRFNTAVLVFLFGILPFLFESKKNKLIFCYLSLLVHFSFLIPVIVLSMYILAGNRKNIYFAIFVASSFISAINISEFNSLVEKYVPAIVSERSEKYRDEDLVMEFREGDQGAIVESKEGVVLKKNWYAIYYLRILYWSLSTILVAMFIFSGRVFAVNKGLLNGYCFSLLMFGIGNIMQSIPSGERYLMVAALITVATLVFYLQNQQMDKYILKFVTLLVPAIILFIIVAIRTGFYSISITTIVGNPVIMLFTDYNLSLNDIIK